MLSFFISIIIYKDCREFFLKKNFLITLLTTIIIILPNIIWNYNNEFVTFSHTTSNANFSDIKLSLLQGINFTLSQIFIFGLIPLFYLTKNFIYFPKLQSIQKIFLICFLFPILIVSILAVFSRANANWAVVGYPFACILLSTLLNFNRKLQINLCLSNQLLFSSFIVFLIFLSPKANYDFFSKIRHIKPLSEMIKNELSVRDNIALMADDREDYAHLVYYLRDIKVKKAKWNGDKRINDHYELTTNHEDLVGNDILLITRTKPTPAMLKKSDSFHKINSFSIPNSKKKRIFNIYLLKNWK
jgi:hypothetical protein